MAATNVYVKNFGVGALRIPSVIHESKGPVSFAVELDDGRIIHRHADVRVSTAKEEPSK